MSKTIKTRIVQLLPEFSAYKTVTVNQIVARLNASKSNAPVANATVRGRLSELVRDNVAGREPRSDGRSGYFLA